MKKLLLIFLTTAIFAQENEMAWEHGDVSTYMLWGCTKIVYYQDYDIPKTLICVFNFKDAKKKCKQVSPDTGRLPTYEEYYEGIKNGKARMKNVTFPYYWVIKDSKPVVVDVIHDPPQVINSPYASVRCLW